MGRITGWMESHGELLQHLGTASLVMFVVTIAVLPVVVAKLPADYFVRDKREPARRSRKRPLLWGALALIKNLLGIVLILAGLAMLVLPGQGTVTILIGLALTNFPGKFALERRIARQPAVGKTLNRIREIAKKPPFVMPAPSD
jgi:archaellum biogenesis protein FlaJ (TadC family)